MTPGPIVQIGNLNSHEKVVVFSLAAARCVYFLYDFFSTYPNKVISENLSKGIQIPNFVSPAVIRQLEEGKGMTI